MKKINMISRIILAVITFILFNIMLINEDSSWNIVPVIFSLIVFCLSFPSTIFAEIIIKVGDKINNKLLKIVYYLFLPIILLAICFIVIVYIIVPYTDGTLITETNEIGEALGQALLFLFIVSVMIIVIIMPYVQAIIINILKKIKCIKTDF